MDCEHDSKLKAAAKLYKEGKITIREASNITGIPLRGILHEFGKRGTYIRYGEDELKEDIE
jgi:predicted HTH domain antitoxin